MCCQRIIATEKKEKKDRNSQHRKKRKNSADHNLDEQESKKEKKILDFFHAKTKDNALGRKEHNNQHVGVMKKKEGDVSTNRGGDERDLVGKAIGGAGHVLKKGSDVEEEEHEETPLLKRKTSGALPTHPAVLSNSSVPATNSNSSFPPSLSSSSTSFLSSSSSIPLFLTSSTNTNKNLKQLSIVDLTKEDNKGPDEGTIACPVCQLQVQFAKINEHLDRGCLA